MIQLLASKAKSGELAINLARQHFENHEWGLARIAIDNAFSKGDLADGESARDLKMEILQRLYAGSKVEA